MKPNIGTSPAYLFWNSYNFCFRLKIPKDIRTFFDGKRELRSSLKTANLTLAKQKARYLAGNIQWLFEILRKNGSGMDELTKERMQLIINKYIRNKLDSLERTRLNRDFIDFDVQKREKENVEDELGTLQCALMANYLRQRETMVQEILKQEGITLGPESMEYKTMCRDYMKSEFEMYKVELKRMQADYTDDVDKLFPVSGDEPKQDIAPQAESPDQEFITLQELIKKFLDEKIRAGIGTGALKQYKASFNLMIKVFGADKQVHTFSSKDSNRFKDILLKMPAGAARIKGYDKKSIDQVIKEGKGKDLMNTATVNSYLTNVGALFGYAFNHEYVQRNYFLNLKIKQRGRPSEEQDIFDTDDLGLIFRSDDYTKDKHKEPYRFWLPILGLYTGCRLEEICQLYLDDIEKVDTIWVLNINESREDQKLKNMASRRIVPLHPFITDNLNLIGYVEKLRSKRQERLFPELKRTQGKYSHYPSRWFGKWKKEAGIQAEPRKKTFHSFRHTFTDNLKQQLVQGAVIEEATGHVVQGEGMGRYGKPYVAKTLLKEAILKLDFGIDLSHLKDSKYVIKN